MSSPARRLSLVALALALGAAARGEPPARTDLYGDPLPPGAVARLGTVRWTSGGFFDRMAFAPDAKHLVTGYSRLAVWDLATGRVVRTISTDRTPAGEGFSHGLTFSRDGKYLLSAEVLGSLRPGGWTGLERKVVLLLWDYSSGKLLAQSSDLDGWPHSLALRNDGLAAYVDRGNVVLWRPGEKAFRPVARPRKGEVVCDIAFSPDGKQLIVLSASAADGSSRARWVEVASGRLLKWVTLRSDINVILAPDNAVGASCRPGPLDLYDMNTGARRPLPVGDSNHTRVSFSPDGRTLLAWDREAESVQLWDVAEGKLLRRLRLPGLRRSESGATLLLSPDGATLASSEVGQVVRLWDARTGRPRLRLRGHVFTPYELAFSADGQEVVSYSLRPDPFGEVYRWEAATGKPLGDFALDAPLDDYLAGALRWLLAPGGRHLALQLRRSLRVFDTRTGKRIDLPDTIADDGDWSFTSDGRTLALPRPDRSIRLWDVTTGKIQGRVELEKKGGPLVWLRYSPDGRTLVTGDRDQKVRLWDAATGKYRRDLTPTPKGGPFGKNPEHLEVTFTPEGRHLFVSSYPYLLGWDTGTGRKLAPVDPDEDAGGGGAGTGPVAVSPDGRLLAWFPTSACLRLYEVCTGRMVHRFEDGRHWSVAFAPSGWRLATACSADVSVLVWDLPLLFRSQPLSGNDARPEVLWDVMAADDAAAAHRALWRLAALPGADAFLARRLTGVEEVPPERLRAMLADLGSPDFAKRKAAEEALAAAGEAARAALAEAAAAAKDPEVRRRLARLSARLRTPEARRLRELRAVLVLEARGTPEARRLLETLAGGAAEARLTQEARAALRRLERRPAP
jgi:WD40 repeat protein